MQCILYIFTHLVTAVSSASSAGALDSVVVLFGLATYGLVALPVIGRSPVESSLQGKENSDINGGCTYMYLSMYEQC